MKIERILPEPLESFPYQTAAAGGGTSPVLLPVYQGFVSGLPERVDALIVTSDLQGVAMDEGCEVQLGELLPEYLALLMAIEFPHLSLQRTVALLCGDLYGDASKRGSSGNPLQVWLAFGETFGWVAGVPGNHDIMESAHMNMLAASDCMHFMDLPALTEILGLRLAGLGGIIGRADKPNRMSQHDYVKWLRKLIMKQPHALLLHQGPDKPALGLEGNSAIRAALEQLPETLVFCGHSHWEPPYATLSNGSQILNADGKVFILLPV